MKEINLNQQKEISLDALKALHSFCVKNNLKYSLFYGTLLGAIRHNGFIPWDDDIDVAMPREDYNFFISHFGTQRFGVKSCETDKYYYLPWAKIYDKNTLKIEPVYTNIKFQIGFNIDLFPLDYVENLKEYLKIRKKEKPTLKLFFLGRHIPRSKHTFIRFIEQALLFPFNFFNPRLANKINLFVLKRHKKKDNFFFVDNDIFVKKDNKLFLGDLFNDLKLHKFENDYFYITKYYDDTLYKCYGDYMQLPPLEERIVHHSYKAYFL